MANPSWTVRYPFPVRERTLRNVAMTPALGGMVQRRQTDLSHSTQQLEPETREWWLAYTQAQPATKAEIEAIESLWEQTLGGVTPIDFTPPGFGSSVPCVMQGQSFSYQRIGPATYATTVVLREQRNDA